MTKLTRLVAGLAIMLVATQTACTGPYEPPPRPSPTSSTTKPPPTAGPGCPAPESTDTQRPELIVGDWICTTSTTQMRFRFSADGRYASRESLKYEVPSGRFVFHRDQEGTYTTNGDRLELTPTRSTRTREMPEDPKGDYTDRPDSLSRRYFTFRAGPTALHLHETGGYALVLLRMRGT